ncbi:hypothetical protein X777_11287 [Ooceraea biroi]|uniref:Reverse transcriptase domain-containing protein n=1 Tax=Ooceraea biroi TaxID=2015173 RepID=A0A026W3W7_OOCBI|nr:hypothetical protein X777_11287 [Ooceraea biroi]
MAKEEGGMSLIIKEFREYIREKRLEMNREKTKIVRFGKRRAKRRTWKWGEGEVEEVEEIKYLGYVFRRNGRQERQIEDRIRKARGVMRNV